MMKLSNDLNDKLVIDGAGTLTLSRNDEAVRIEGNLVDGATIKNFSFIVCPKTVRGKLWVMGKVLLFLFKRKADGGAVRRSNHE